MLMLAGSASGSQTVQVIESFVEEGAERDRPVARVIVRNTASRRLRALWVSCEWILDGGRTLQATEIIRDVPQGRSVRRPVRGPWAHREAEIQSVRCRTRRNALYY
jgi:hypothetical protein